MAEFESGRWVLEASQGWRFSPRRVWRWGRHGREAPSDAEAVCLPHCWNARDGFEEGVAYRRGPGTYWKRLVVPRAGQAGTWRLRSEGFYGTGDVLLDGRRAMRVDGRYLGFTCELPDAVAERGEVAVTVRLTNRCGRNVLPGIAMPDFLLHGGLAGRMWLEFLPATHLEDDPLVRTGLDADGECGWVEVAATAAGNRAGVSVACEVVAPDGEVVGRGEAAPGSAGDAACRVAVAAVRRWDVDAPVLYAARVVLRDEAGGVLDAVERRVGFRTAEFRPDEGFFLNGRRVELAGCNRHESQPGFGSALPVALHERDARLIKTTGLNFVRLSHYPQHPAFLDACDRLGLLVYAELASWKRVRGGGWLRSALAQWDAMIRRDRHRPCVIVWGMGNEGRHRGAFLALRRRARDLDPDRPVTYAENHYYRAIRRRTTGIPDVWGLNYEFGALEAGRDASALRTVIVSESSNYPPGERGAAAEELAQVELIRDDLAKFRNRRYVAGFALWCLADYGTLRKARYRRHCGMVDAWREPKLAAHWLRACFGREAVLHTMVAAGGDRLVIVSNREALQLRVDGVVVQESVPLADCLATADLPAGWRVAEVAGGAEAGVARVERWGSAAAVSIEPADDGPGGTDAPRRIRVAVTDEQGRVVRDWRGAAYATVEGDGVIHYHTARPEVELAGGTGVCHVTVPPGCGARLRVRVEGVGSAERVLKAVRNAE